MSGIAKVLHKLQASVDAGNFYEAHEMCKTVYHRYRSRKQHEQSYELAQGAAALQLGRGQLNCGVELCMMLVEAYEADEVEPSEGTVGRLVSLVDAFPVVHPEEGGPEPPLEPCSKFVAAAVKWLARQGGLEFVPRLESRLAAYIRACVGWQGLGYALPHYALAQDACAFAAAVAEAAVAAPAFEQDLILARAALTTAAAMASGASSSAALAAAACAAQLAAAKALVAAYPAAAVAAGVEDAAAAAAVQTPLAHFVQLLLEALERQSLDLVKLLAGRYRDSLDRDPGLWQLVARCREVHIPSAAQGGLGGGGGIMDMLRMLTGPQ